MNISLKKCFAGVSAVAIMLSTIGTAVAAYADVPAGVWYEEAVDDFVAQGHLDATQTNFRGQDNALRAEFVKLVVMLNGGLLNEAPAVPSFDDVATGAWYYAYFEEAATEGWVRGDGSCYGKHPCYARPGANINRAEAAAVLVRAFGLDPSGSAPQFVDNPSGQWYTADIQTAADHCVLQGDDSTGRVRPSDNMNRAEMVVMVHRVDQGMTYGTDCGTAPQGDPQVKSARATSATVVEVDFNVSVDQTAATDKSKYTVTGGAALPIESVKMLGTDAVEITLTSALDANSQYTLTVVDMKTSDGKMFSDSVTFPGYTSVVQGNGTLEVSLSAKNPLGDTIPKGSQGVTFTSLDLAAVGDDVWLENLTILHEGFGDSADFSGVYALVDGTRVTRKRTIDTQSYTSTLRFTKPLEIKAGRSVTLHIAGDLQTTAVTASEHALSVELPSDVVSNAKTVKGNFPMKGKMFRVAAVTSGVVSIAYRSVTPTQVKVGDKAVKLGKFELSINSAEDQTVYSMTLENDGTAGDGEYANLQIRRSDGTVLTKTVAATVGDFATFVFDPPFTVLEGDRITLDVVGDIVGGAAKNVKLHFDETGDIFAVGSLYGYGVGGQLYGSSITLPTETSTLPSTVTIDAGQFTISIDGPVTKQYTRKDKNAVLANVFFETGGEDINVEELYVLIQGTTSTGAAFTVGRGGVGSTVDEVDESLESVEMRNTTTGRTISGVKLTASTDSGTDATGQSGSGAFQVYRFDDFIVKGKEKYEFRVNFIDNSGTSAVAAPANGDKFRIHICGEATHNLSTANVLQANTTGCTMGGFFASTVTSYHMKITGVSTNDRVGDYRPGGTISGNNQEIKTSGLTVTVKALSATDTTVQNAKNVNLLRFEARANEAKDILITSGIFEAAASSSLVNASNYTLWVDTNDDGITDTILQRGVASQSGQITFDKLTGGGYVVAKQKAVTFEVHGDISASLTGTSPVLAIRFDTGATFLSAEQVDDGTSLSGITTTNPAGTTVATNGSYTDGGSTAEVVVKVSGYGTAYTLRNQGDLFVIKSTSPVKSRQLKGGTLGDEILRLQFHPEYEDADVTDLVFTASGAAASDFATNVDRLELYKVGATTPFATATVAGCGSDSVASNSMCVKMKNQEFVVPKGSNTNVLVRPRMRNDVNGADAGDRFALMLDATPSTSTGSVRARGLLSSNTLTANDRDSTAEGEVFIGTSTAANNARVIGNVNEVVLSKVISITNADPNANGTAIPTGTSRAIAQFKFATAADVAGNENSKNGVNKWTLSGVIFNVNATNVHLGSGDQTAAATSDFKIYNKADPTTTSTCLADKATASGSSLVVTCDAIPTRSSVNTQLEPGTDITFVLQADITNAKISNSSTSTLQVSLQNFSDNVYYATFSSTTSHLVWLDKDDGATDIFRFLEYPETSVNGTSYAG